MREFLIYFCQSFLNLFHVMKYSLSYWMSLPIAAVYDSRAPGDPVSVQIPKVQRDQYFSILLTSYAVNGPFLLVSSTVTLLGVIFQTLVYTVSAFSGISSGTGSWFFDLEGNPLKTGQIGMYFRKAVLFTMLIPMGKS